MHLLVRLLVLNALAGLSGSNRKSSTTWSADDAPLLDYRRRSMRSDRSRPDAGSLSSPPGRPFDVARDRERLRYSDCAPAVELP